MPYEVGTAFLTIIPSFLDFEKRMTQEVRKAFGVIEKIPEKALPEGFSKGLKEAIRRSRGAAKEGAEETAETLAGHFANTLRSRLEAAYLALPKLETS